MYSNKRGEIKECILEKENTGKTESKADSMVKIREIMGKLNKRVDNFGNEWLINRPIEKNNTYEEVATI